MVDGSSWSAERANHKQECAKARRSLVIAVDLVRQGAAESAGSSADRGRALAQQQVCV